MDRESIHSANSQKSHATSVNCIALSPHQFSNFDANPYPPIDNNFPTFQYANNSVQMYNPPFYTYNQPIVNNSYMFNPNQHIPDPTIIVQNNGYNNPNHGDFVNTEKIQVQIVPQDDNWGPETCTAITSDTGGSADNFEAFCDTDSPLQDDRPGWDCVSLLGNAVFMILCILCLGSPIAMIAMPQLSWLQWSVNSCGPACEAQLIGLSTKMLILIVGTIALHCRHRSYSVTHISMFRSFVLFLAFVVVFAYWIFYSFRILEKRLSDIHSIVLFSASLVDTLLFVHYLAIVLLEIYHMQVVFCVKVTRSPDGVSRFYRLGRMSLQSAAIHILQNYVTDFQDYNYHLAQSLQRKCFKRYQSKHNSTPNETPEKKTKYKVYNIDCADKNNETVTDLMEMKSTSIPKIGTGTSARLFEEAEWEKKFRKRQMRLLVAVEEAFSHVQSCDEALLVDEDSKKMAPLEAAQTILPAIIKPLQKLLRVSRRHLYYSSSTVIDHIAQCLSFRLSPKFFVQQFSPNVPVMESLLANEKSNKTSASKPLYLSWNVICDRSLSKSLDDGVCFKMEPQNCKGEQLSLVCSVHRVPFFNLEEKHFIESQCRFLFHSNSETSV